MNTIDFDATVEFVWDWVAQFNSYLAQNGWLNDVKNLSSTRGLSDTSLNDIANHLFQMVLKAEHPHHVMKALEIQLQSLIRTNRSPALPQVYVEIRIENGGIKREMWSTNNFCATLEKDVNRIVSKFESFQTLGEQHFATAAQRKPNL